MKAGPAPTAVVFAYHTVGTRCLEALLGQGVNVALVLTHEDDPGEAIWFDSVAQLAKKHGIPVITPEDPNAPDVAARIAALAPDFFFSFYYRRMLGADLLAVPRRGAYNMHGSLLPKYRGRVPINWAILKGETETGATLHEMVAKPDAGRIAGRQAVPIGPDETALEVFHKVTAAAVAVLERALPGLIDGSLELKPQNLSAGSYYGGRKPEDGRIDWSQPAKAIHDLVRAVAPPYPGAYTDILGRRLRVLRTRIATDRSAQPGGPGLYCERGALYADCADGRVLQLVETEGLTDVQALADKKIPFEQQP